MSWSTTFTITCNLWPACIHNAFILLVGNRKWSSLCISDGYIYLTVQTLKGTFASQFPLIVWKRLKLKALVLLYNSTYDGWSQSLSTSLRACGTWPKPRLNEFEVQVWESLWQSTPKYCTFALENSGVMCVVYDVYFCNDVLYFPSCFWIYRTWNIRAFWGMIFFLIDLWKVKEKKKNRKIFLPQIDNSWSYFCK